jgi:hypothetical protein
MAQPAVTARITARKAGSKKFRMDIVVFLGALARRGR